MNNEEWDATPSHQQSFSAEYLADPLADIETVFFDHDSYSAAPAQQPLAPSPQHIAKIEPQIQSTVNELLDAVDASVPFRPRVGPDVFFARDRHLQLPGAVL